jgi:hypothetical protein
VFSLRREWQSSATAARRVKEYGYPYLRTPPRLVDVEKTPARCSRSEGERSVSTSSFPIHASSGRTSAMGDPGRGAETRTRPRGTAGAAFGALAKPPQPDQRPRLPLVATISLTVLGCQRPPCAVRHALVVQSVWHRRQGGALLALTAAPAGARSSLRMRLGCCQTSRSTAIRSAGARSYAKWVAAVSDHEGLVCIATPGAIEVDGDQATTRLYTSEVYTAKDGTTVRRRGRYDDVLARRQLANRRASFGRSTRRSLHLTGFL